MTENLPELRDIHLPDGVSIFPPAYGWWVILVTAFFAVLLINFFIKLRKRSKKNYAISLINNLNTNNHILAAKDISEVLRRICVYKYPAASSLYNNDWIIFLNNHAKLPLSEKTAQLLANAPYLPVDNQTFTKQDCEDLRNFALEWIGENL